MADLIATNKSFLVAIADAIRAKTGKTELLTLKQMEADIHDIVSAPDGSEIEFGGTNSTQSELYSIPSEILNAIVAEIQKMSGRNKPLTPDEMLYWLRKVVYIPQGYAESINTIVSQTSSANGIVPTVHRGTAISTQSIFNTSNAVGSIVESV